MIPGHRSEIRVPAGVHGNEGDKLDFRVWPDENGLLDRYAYWLLIIARLYENNKTTAQI